MWILKILAQSTETRHQAVLLEEILEWFAVDSRESSLIVDCTLGGAGHSAALLEAGAGVFIVGMDQDTSALERAAARLEPYAGRTFLANENFRRIAGVLAELPGEVLPEELKARGGADGLQADCVLADLGISSDQLGAAERGFAFSADGPLDMRMDRNSALSADTVVNEYSKNDLVRVFRRGGVGTASGALAAEIVKRRPIPSTTSLAAICEEVINRARRRKGASSRKNPATVPFQAIRIEVNDELGALDEFLSSLPEVIAPGGRIAVISFHSLEDKLVAKTFRAWSRPVSELRRLPVQGESSSFGRLLTKHAVVPGEHEQQMNPRSRSARLRVFERGREEGYAV